MVNNNKKVVFHRSNNYINNKEYIHSDQTTTPSFYENGRTPISIVILHSITYDTKVEKLAKLWPEATSDTPPGSFT